MRRGTTPTVTVEVDKDITYLNVHLSFAQGDVLIVKESENGDLEMAYDGSKTTVTATLTQEDTLAFGDGVCEVQIRGFTEGGVQAMATGIATEQVKRILEEGVLPHEDDGSDSE